MSLPDTMQAVVFVAPGKWELREVPAPKIRAPGQVLVEIEAAGICGTDVHILHDPPGHPGTVGTILGHEFTGKVVEAGEDVTHISPGNRVAADPNITCGCCAFCQDGFHNMCENMTTLGIFINGGFAKYTVAPARQLYVLPPELAPDKAAFTEPLACVLNGVRRLEPAFGESGLVLGGGPIGLLFALCLKASGLAAVGVSEPNPARRKFAEKLGAAGLDPASADFDSRFKENLGDYADMVIDAVGSLFSEAVSRARPGGRVLLFGQNTKAVCADFCQNDITRKELTVLGSYIARHTFPQAVRLLAQGVIDPEPLISMRLPLSSFGEGLAAMQSGDAVKVILKP
ncbi:MAG: alcohol dehydrogenase catalytic domain-containing protein [bacterium]